MPETIVLILLAFLIVSAIVFLLMADFGPDFTTNTAGPEEQINYLENNYK